MEVEALALMPTMTALRISRCLVLSRFNIYFLPRLFLVFFLGPQL
jgi:hypothetical protein